MDLKKQPQVQPARPQTRGQAKTFVTLDFIRNMNDYVYFLAFESQDGKDMEVFWENNVKNRNHVNLDSSRYEQFTTFKKQTETFNTDGYFRWTDRFSLFVLWFCSQDVTGVNTEKIISERSIHILGDLYYNTTYALTKCKKAYYRWELE